MKVLRNQTPITLPRRSLSISNPFTNCQFRLKSLLQMISNWTLGGGNFKKRTVYRPTDNVINPISFSSTGCSATCCPLFARFGQVTLFSSSTNVESSSPHSSPSSPSFFFKIYLCVTWLINLSFYGFSHHFLPTGVFLFFYPIEEYKIRIFLLYYWSSIHKRLGLKQIISLKPKSWTSFWIRWWPGWATCRLCWVGSFIHSTRGGEDRESWTECI
jgi:hypothetical protein